VAKGKRPTRQRTTDELLHDVLRAARILDEALTRFDAGDDLAVDLISGRLRLLVGHGKGNELLQRICDRLGRKQPLVACGREVPDDPTIRFALGALPQDESETPTVPLGTFVGRRCLVADDGTGQQVFSWDDLISETANKMLLVHSDDDVPAIFDEIVTYEVGEGHHVIPFMMRSAGLLILGAAAEVIQAAGMNFVPGAHSRSSRGMRVEAVEVRGSL
jgi:hypothetical protein